MTANDDTMNQDKRNSLIVKLWYGCAIIVMIIIFISMLSNRFSIDLLITCSVFIVIMCLLFLIINLVLNKHDKFIITDEIRKIIITDTDRKKYLNWKICISAICCLFPVGLWLLIWYSGPIFPGVVLGVIGTFGLIIFNVVVVYYWDTIIRSQIYIERRKQNSNSTNNRTKLL